MPELPENILALDTSLPSAQLWLRYHGHERTLTEHCPKGASMTVLGWLEELSQEFPSLWEELDAYGLNIGPGRFNGVRLGLSIVGTLMALHPKPIISCTTFDLLRSVTMEPGIERYAVFAKKGHAYVQRHGESCSELRTFEDLDPQSTSALQCPELGARAAHEMVPLSQIEDLHLLGKTEQHMRFEDVVPVYTTLI